MGDHEITMAELVRERCEADANRLETLLLDGQHLAEAANALAVIVTDPEVRGYLETNDPMALHQAREALGLTEVAARVEGHENAGDLEKLNREIQRWVSDNGATVPTELLHLLGDLDWQIRNEGDTTYRTKSGKLLTDEDIQALADEAERGYEIDKS